MSEWFNLEEIFRAFWWTQGVDWIVVAWAFAYLNVNRLNVELSHVKTSFQWACLAILVIAELFINHRPIYIFKPAFQPQTQHATANFPLTKSFLISSRELTLSALHYRLYVNRLRRVYTMQGFIYIKLQHMHNSPIQTSTSIIRLHFSSLNSSSILFLPLGNEIF